MIVKVLFSGSKGNCTYISDGDTSILVDAGGSLKRIRDILENGGYRLDDINGIFVTHEHTDHVNALYAMSKKYNIKIYTSIETARAFCTPCNSRSMDDCRRVAANVMTVKPDKTYEIGTISAKTFSTPHDTKGSMGFVFTSLKDEKSIGYATDIGYVTDTMKEMFCGLKNVIIESNHDVKLLKNGSYPQYLKERILSDRGHLSNEDCGEFIRELAEHGCKSFVLAHLSEENNIPSIALECAVKALDGYDAVVKVASAYKETQAEIF